MGISSLIYDTWMRETQYKKYKGMLDLLLKNSISLDGKVLDVGIGTGLFEDYLKGKGINLDVIGIDTDRKMLSEAKKKGYLVMLANAEKLPFEDNSFDLVICIDTIHAVPNKEEVIKEIKRVMKPGAFALISHFCNNFTRNQILKKMEALTRSFEVIDTKTVGNVDNELSVTFIVKKEVSE
ncbi:MAG: class I SAM-dependent methyltransferase [Caldisphaeraceae archaeon]|nr:class I SAM-dependent methyltransferase [Caldisphaeraceae archaeon]